jgi:hypothetical protein
MVRFKCPDCELERDMDDSLAGKKVRCPKCNAASLVNSLPVAQIQAADPSLAEDVRAIRAYAHSIWLAVVVGPMIIAAGGIVVGFVLWMLNSPKPTP